MAGTLQKSMMKLVMMMMMITPDGDDDDDDDDDDNDDDCIERAEVHVTEYRSCNRLVYSCGFC